MSAGPAAVVSALLAGGAVVAAGAARRAALARLGAVGAAARGGGLADGRLRRPGSLRRVRPAEVDLPLLCGELAAVMRAGLPPIAAWEALAERRGPQARVCRQVLAAARPATGPARAGSPRHTGTGTGLAAAVLTVAAQVGTARGRGRAGPLRWLGLGLAVSDRSGAPMADVLGRLTAALRAEAAAEADRAAVMAGPRATAAVLSLLPVAGIGLGVLIGADPVRTLLTTPAGRGCLVAGLLLWGAGAWWASSLLRRAERAGGGP